MLNQQAVQDTSMFGLGCTNLMSGEHNSYVQHANPARADLTAGGYDQSKAYTCRVL